MLRFAAENALRRLSLWPRTFSADELKQKMGDFNYFGLRLLKPGGSITQANDEINALQKTITAGLVGEEKA